MNNKVLLKQIASPARPYLLTKNITIENRIPKDYFITKGKGESEITIHAGSYHLALKDAGIEMCNIMTYSSILPAIATEVKKEGVKTVHGSVMESIMAAANAAKGERATAGIIFGWLYDKHDNSKYGGLVCEYNGDKSVKNAKEQLKESLDELYNNGYSDNFFLSNIKLITESFIPIKKYGTAIVALCFINHLIPLAGEG